MDRDRIYTMEAALERLRGLIGFAGTWTDIATYLPDGWAEDPVKWRSATASTFAASLELVKEGRAELRQSGTFGPIELRRTDPRRER
jgi:segregation and condensation protein A